MLDQLGQRAIVIAERRALGLLARVVETTLVAYREQQQRPDLDDDARASVDEIVADAEAEQLMIAALIEADVGWWTASAAVAKLLTRMRIEEAHGVAVEGPPSE